MSPESVPGEKPGHFFQRAKTMKFILGRKLDMSQMFDEKGNLIPVTLLLAGPCFVIRKKGMEKDKYEAVQIGFEKIKDNKISKSKKAAPYRHVKEFKKGVDFSKYNEGDSITASIFKPGERVMVSAMSKGKGFQGAVKRCNFGGKPATHGMKHEERGMGSVASGIPGRGRITPGRPMPGRLGYERTSVKNLEVIKVDAEKNLLAVRGAVPGGKGALVEITSE